ncbi:STAS domain-containing protein [Desulfobacterales bacterium HSG16]|nr:STAS domain-containing protein [Desulfobacterales bacterium HSG16]
MAESEMRTVVPVNMLWDKILMLPIFGTIDSARGQEIMESMLKKIIATKSKVIILDILGVPIVDSAVANHLIKITKATQLIGSEAIISGISAEIAQTMVSLGIELGNVTTTADLADAVQLAFDKTGYVIKKAT